MPTRVIVQPNGFLAIFSTVVDDFVNMNLTIDEAERYLVHQAIIQARYEVRAKIWRALEEQDHLLRPRDPGYRWEEALNTIRTCRQGNGKQLADARKRLGTAQIHPKTARPRAKNVGSRGKSRA